MHHVSGVFNVLNYGCRQLGVQPGRLPVGRYHAIAIARDLFEALPWDVVAPSSPAPQPVFDAEDLRTRDLLFDGTGYFAADCGFVSSINP